MKNYRGSSLTVLLVVVCAFFVAGTLYFTSPLRTKIPSQTTPVNTIRELQKLNREDRELVLGYLLRQRKEILSTFMRDDAKFDAKTFADAIEAQKAFLEKQGYMTPSAFLMVGLRDQALRPLRETVSVELIERALMTKREIFHIPDGYSTRYGNGIPEEDKPILTVTYRIRNLTARAIEKVEGGVDIRKASYGRIEQGFLSSCYFKSVVLAPDSYEDVKCNNVSKSFDFSDKDFLDTPNEKLFMVWTPHHVVFSDGKELIYKDYEAESGLLWGFYRVKE